MDLFKNFAVVTVNTTYGSADTSIVLSAGHGATLPSTPFNVVWWDSDTYSNPEDDPNKEIVRVKAVSTDTLTVERGQEGTSASTKNTAGKTYKMRAGLTARTQNMLSPRKGIYIVDHFINSNGDTPWVVTTSGTGSPGLNGSSVQLEANHQGVTRLKTGTATTGLAVISKNVTGLYFSGGAWLCEWEIYLPTVPDATDDFIVRVGFGDSVSSATDHSDGAYAELDRSASANWRVKTASNSVRTATNSSVAWAVGWWRFSVLVNPAASSVEYYINGTLVHTETTNIPSIASRLTTVSAYINKIAGTNERSIHLDYMLLENFFTNEIT
jgi:hypothetical protein